MVLWFQTLDSCSISPFSRALLPSLAVLGRGIRQLSAPPPDQQRNLVPQECSANQVLVPGET
jgi:hypothetical protein